MKRIAKSIFIISLFLFAAMSFTTIVNVAAQDDPHGGHDADNECDTPSQTVMINTHDSALAFDKTVLKVEKGACVMFMFSNTQVAEHDFTIEKADGTEWTHLHLANSLDNETGPSPGVRMAILQMPDEDISFHFLCTVVGHEAAGMEGTLIVGEGSPSDDDSLPGFGLFTAFAGIFGLVAISTILKRKN